MRQGKRGGGSRRWRAGAAGIVASLILAGLPAGSPGIERKVVPPFQVYTLTGERVSSEMFLTGRTVLVYVKPACDGCDRLLKVLARGHDTPLPAQTVVLVLGTSADAAELAAAHPKLAAARWLADRDLSALQAFQIRTVPALVGLLDGLAAWAIAGLPADTKVVETAYRTWLGPEAPPRR